MSSSSLIATRYARALFELAAEKKQQDSVEKDMRALLMAISESAMLRSFFTSPVVTREQAEIAILAVLEKLEAHDLTQKFFVLLARQRRLAAADVIIETYLKSCSENRGEIEVRLTSATKLAASEQQELVDAIAKKLDKKITVHTEENPELIGGVQVRVGSMMLDNSIAGKLARLRLALARAA